MPDLSALLWPFAVAMAAATAVLISWAAETRSVLRAAAVVFLLAMMGAMLVGIVAYFLAPGPTGLVAALWLSSGLMSLSALIVFYAYVRMARASAQRAAEAPMARRGSFLACVIALVLVNELLMGWGFLLAAGGSPAGGSSGLAALANGLSSVVSSSWFLFTMSMEMVLTALFLRRHISRALLALLLLQAAIMFLSPTALASGAWAAWSIYLGSALMIGVVVLAMEYLYRHRQPEEAFARYLGRLFAVYAVMMAGLFVWLDLGSPDLFALSVVAEMVLFFDVVLRWERFQGGRRLTWQLDAAWTFRLLAFIFVAELFMGALLDLQIEPSQYAGTFFTLPVTALPPTVSFTLGYNAIYNGFWFLAEVTGSTWFLAMMGVEMGLLVLFKFRETSSVETRVRLGLMMGCYAAFAVFFPSLYYNTLFPNAPSQITVPVLGWSMGVGSAPLAASVFGVLLLTYVITGALVALFGRRVVCSVFCTAPLMYQGTTIDAMKSFNHSSGLAHRYLGSRFSRLYSVTTGLVMGSLLVACAASYFDTTGQLNVYILGADPTVFLFALYFGILWYVLFVTIPYTGNYNCVTMGWCYTGTVAQAFHKIGFSKLKVRDKNVCRACTTLDCAKACPVGLVDMPGHFRTRGEFRSTKCCGVGSCAGACPYGNLYLYDVRHWVRRRLGLPEAPPATGRLPVIASARSTPSRLAVPVPRAVPAAEPGSPPGPGAVSDGAGA